MLICGVASAGVVAGLYLHKYSPTGVYQLKNILLSPETVRDINFLDKNPLTGKNSRYTFDKIEFSYWEQKLKQRITTRVEQEAYEKLFIQLSGDLSLGHVSKEIVGQFQRSQDAILSLSVKLLSENSDTPLKAFQEVEFATSGDYYRVEVHEQNRQEVWQYFHHPDILKLVISILTVKKELPHG